MRIDPAQDRVGATTNQVRAEAHAPTAVLMPATYHAPTAAGMYRNDLARRAWACPPPAVRRQASRLTTGLGGRPYLRSERSEKGRDREEPLVKRIGGETKLLERDGAQEWMTPWRPSEEERRPFSLTQSDPHFSHAVDDTFAAGQFRRSLFQDGQLQLGNNHAHA